MGGRRRRAGLVAGAVAVFAAAAPSCTDDGPWRATAAALVPCGGSTTEVYATHQGVDPSSTSVDIYRPSPTDGDCNDRPLVVWVHGGAWTGGDKADHIEDKVTAFTEAGFVFASVNYRLTDASLDPPAPQYPVHDDDTAAAVAWLVEHAEALGIDADRVALLGHSAGGGIVAAVTTDDSFLARHGLELADIDCAGSIDGEGYDVMAGATHAEPFVHDVYLDAFGTDPATWVAASPMTHVAPDRGIPDYLVVARGPDMRLDLHREFAAALDAAGVPVTVIDARSLDHAEVSVDIGAPGDTVVTPALMDFLDGCFADPAERAGQSPDGP